jgi:hypothetical protein
MSRKRMKIGQISSVSVIKFHSILQKKIAKNLTVLMKFHFISKMNKIKILQIPTGKALPDPLPTPPLPQKIRLGSRL